MNENEGTVDRVLRVIVGAGLLAIAYFLLEGYVAWIVAVVGGVAVLTGAIGWCPAYAIFGLSTC